MSRPTSRRHPSSPWMTRVSVFGVGTVRATIDSGTHAGGLGGSAGSWQARWPTAAPGECAPGADGTDPVRRQPGDRPRDLPELAHFAGDVLPLYRLGTAGCGWESTEGVTGRRGAPAPYTRR